MISRHNNELSENDGSRSPSPTFAKLGLAAELEGIKKISELPMLVNPHE